MNIQNNRDFDLFINEKTDLSDLKIGKDGSLKEKSFFDKIKDVFTSKEELQENKKAVKEKLVSYIQSIPADQPDKIKKIFEKISRLRDSQLIFDLKNQGVITRDIENTLSEDLKRLRKEKSEIKGPDKDKKLEEIKLAIRIEKARLGQRMGVDFIKNKGATGTALIKNLKGKYIGVFKPTHEHTPLKARLLNTIKRIFTGQLSYLNSKTDAQAKAEVAAYQLDRHFGFGLSPPSKYVELKDKTGTFQSFLKDWKEAKDFLDTSDGVALPHDSFPWTLEEFQKMAIFDYLIGNLDRHEENWGIATIKKQGKEVESLVVIDNANSFLSKNPAAEGAVKNQYKWKALEMAKTSLEPATVKFVQQNLTDKKLDAFISQIKKDDPDFLTPEMEEGLKDRLYVIQLLANRKGTPAQLGRIVSDADIQKAIHEYKLP